MSGCQDACIDDGDTIYDIDGGSQTDETHLLKVEYTRSCMRCIEVRIKCELQAASHSGRFCPLRSLTRENGTKQLRRNVWLDTAQKQNNSMARLARLKMRQQSRP